MRRLPFVFFLVIIVMSVLACVNQDSGDHRNYKNILATEAKSRLDTDEEIILLDVRSQEEYEAVRIPGSVLIPVEVIAAEALSRLQNRNAVIFIYCRSGRRSAAAAEILVKLGFTNIYNLGGINDWPYETESGEPENTTPQAKISKFRDK